VSLELAFEVDAELLDRLEHYQEVWQTWRPDLFRHRVRISAEAERSRHLPPIHRAVAAFSAGVDSTFSLLRHKKGLAGRATRNIQSAVMVHGFDVPLESEAGFQNLRRHGEAITSSLGIDLFVIRTNWREIGLDYRMTFGTGLAAVLHQFSGSHDVGLMATEESYENCDLIWGSNFFNDKFFSSSTFGIESDGGAQDRIQRVRLIGSYPGLSGHLRVCWAGPRTGENCGDCPKCVLTMLDFLVAGLGDAWPFPVPLTAEHIMALPMSFWGEKVANTMLEALKGRNDIDAQLLQAVGKRVDQAGTPNTWKWVGHQR
jgi:hypothetical protein